MEPAEIREEIERRKKRAVDLKLRETLWTLYSSHLKYYAENLKKDPEMIYPEIRGTLETSDSQIQFQIETIAYQIIYKEGAEDRESDWDSRRGSIYDETTTTPITLALIVGGVPVFDFEMKKTVRYTPDAPIFNEILGNVSRFIEGQWITNVGDLLQKMKAHEKEVREKRQAPKAEQKLREDMKRFGL
jgi:hypothetical protein